MRIRTTVHGGTVEVDVPEPLLTLEVNRLSRRTRQTPTGASWHIVARVGGHPLWQAFYGHGDISYDFPAQDEAEALNRATGAFGRWFAAQFAAQLGDRPVTHQPVCTDGTDDRDRPRYRESYADDDILFHAPGCRPGRCVPHGGQS